MDVTIVSPISGVQNGDLKVSNQSLNDADYRAKEAFNKKMRDYDEICSNRGIKFIPFVISTTGKIHNEATNFLMDLATKASDRRHVNVNVIYNYYLKILSVCLAKHIAHNISSRCCGWFSNNLDVHGAYVIGNERAIDIGGTEADQ